MGVRVGTASAALALSFVVGCIASVSADPTSVLTNPGDPSQTLATTPSTIAVCGTICDALIADYGVPSNLKDACIFECAEGFAKAPDACYELVACVADHSLCTANDISPACAQKAGACFAQWSLANGTCRGCWEPSRTVHGKQIVTYLSEGVPSADPRPEDFSTSAIAALLPSSGSEPYRFPGTGDPDGSYTISNVPGCGVWIQVGKTYTWAGNGDVDTSYVYPGRRNAAIAGDGTTYEIQAQNLVPWTQGDWLEFFVPQLGNFNGGFWDIDPSAGMQIKDGATSYLWSYQAGNAALVDPAQHDVIYFAHLPATARPDGTLVRTVRRAARITDFAPKSGMPNAVTANLVDVPDRFVAHIDFRLSTFHAHTADLHPASQLGPGPDAAVVPTGTVDIWTHPGRPRVGATAELVLIDNDTLKSDLAPFDVSFGSPYGADWGIDAAANVFWNVPLHDRNNKTFIAREIIGITAPLDRQGASPYEARLSPPRNVRVNGVPGATIQNGATTTPRIEWDPPAVGAPTAYRVELHKLVVFAGAQGRGEIVATFDIPTLKGATSPAIRSFGVPPGLIVAGTDYYFDVTARDTSSERDDTADVITSEYRP